MRIAIGGDHAGFSLKGQLVEYLRSEDHVVVDHGSYTPEPVDFPDIAQAVCAAVRQGDAERGIMVCGTGVGACIAANKIPGIRAAVCHDTYCAHQCIEHDNVNVLCIGAQIVGIELVKEIVRTYLHAQFSTEAHFRRRVAKLVELERQAARELSSGNI
jgi:ribose 5-phosphate isomerase B